MRLLSIFISSLCFLGFLKFYLMNRHNILNRKKINDFSLSKRTSSRDPTVLLSTQDHKCSTKRVWDVEYTFRILRCSPSLFLFLPGVTDRISQLPWQHALTTTEFLANGMMEASGMCASLGPAHKIFPLQYPQGPSNDLMGVSRQSRKHGLRTEGSQCRSLTPLLNHFPIRKWLPETFPLLINFLLFKLTKLVRFVTEANFSYLLWWQRDKKIFRALESSWLSKHKKLLG